MDTREVTKMVKQVVTGTTFVIPNMVYNDLAKSGIRRLKFPMYSGIHRTTEEICTIVKKALETSDVMKHVFDVQVRIKENDGYRPYEYVEVKVRYTSPTIKDEVTEQY